jgi:hypothetical protein
VRWKANECGGEEEREKRRAEEGDKEVTQRSRMMRCNCNEEEE